jgi:hypothetical protein
MNFHREIAKIAEETQRIIGVNRRNLRIKIFVLRSYLRGRRRSCAFMQLSIPDRRLVNFFLQLQKAVDKLFGAGRTTRNINIHWK